MIEEVAKFLQEKWKVVALILGAFLSILFFFWFGQIFTPKEQEEADEMDLYEQLIAAELQEELQKEEEPVEKQEVELPQVADEIVVDVKGAVHQPGVYRMNSGNRIVDAIEKAGGLLETAEQNAVNLAQIVEDQMVIYVPEIGEEGYENQSAYPVSGQNISPEETETSPIDINTADIEALKTLNGIGDTKAASIIKYREEMGFFQSIEEIKNVSGIGEATFENLKDDITVAP